MTLLFAAQFTKLGKSIPLHSELEQEVPVLKHSNPNEMKGLVSLFHINCSQPKGPENVKHFRAGTTQYLTHREVAQNKSFHGSAKVSQKSLTLAFLPLLVKKRQFGLGVERIRVGTSQNEAAV